MELIDQLPTACRLNEAILNDPEAAEQLAARPKPKESWTPRVAEYDLPAIMARENLAALHSIKQAIVATGGGKPKPQKPFPVPRTELDRVREDLDRQFSVDIIGMFGFDESDL